MVFNQDAINAAVQKALSAPNTIPGDHKAALLTVVDQSGVRVVAAAKIGDNWRVQSTVEHPWSGGLEGGISLQASW